MKSGLVICCAFSLILSIIPVSGSPSFKKNIFEKIYPSTADIPEGFMYGKVPRIYQNVLKGNPWQMDSDAIRRLADKVYPGGNYSSINAMHVSIITNKNAPFGDDIVCYLILFNGGDAAKNEIKKINQFASYNTDRVIVITKDNLAVFLLVDEVDNFHYIKSLATMIEERVNQL
jgi:hypothetical protein